MIIIALISRRRGKEPLYQHIEDSQRGSERTPKRSCNHPSLVCSSVCPQHKSPSLGHQNSFFCSHYSLQLSLYIPAPWGSFSQQPSSKGKNLAVGVSGGTSRKRGSHHPSPAPAVSGQSPLGRQSYAPPHPTWGHLPFLMTPDGKSWNQDNLPVGLTSHARDTLTPN